LILGDKNLILHRPRRLSARRPRVHGKRSAEQSGFAARTSRRKNVAAYQSAMLVASRAL